MPAQQLAQQVSSPDLDVDVVDYFGVAPENARNVDVFGLRPRHGGRQELYRVSYLYLLVFGNDDSPTDYGGMQLRAETFLWLDEGSVPLRMQKLLQNAAHRAAYIFDSSIETPAYGANEWASGYLSGFDPWENAHEYDNWEIEPVARGEVHTEPGVIDWSSEIYLEVDELDYANLSGVATGLANPWSARQVVEEGEPAVHIPPTKWVIRWETSRDPPEYYVRPEPRTDASRRYVVGAGQGKAVYVNGLKIGSLGPKGRVWLRPEYKVGDGREYRGNHSRAGLLAKSDDATPSALRKNGRLYQTGETEDAIYLVTARAKPEGYEAADPDDVPVDVEVQAGRPSRTFWLLSLDDPEDPLEIEAREDRQVVKHLGLSNPRYAHRISEAFRHPGHRPVEPHHIETSGGGGSGQAGLDDFGGES